MFEVSSLKSIVAAVGLALAFGVSGASAATVACESVTFNNVTYDLAERFTPNTGCEVSAPPSANYDVNDLGFFGKSDWTLISKSDDDGFPSISDNKSGTFGLGSLWDMYERVIAVVKGPNTYGVFAYELENGATQITYLTPFITTNPGNGKTQFQDISHVGLWGEAKETTAPIPLPAAGWLLVSGLASLGVAGLRRRRKCV
mgnify:FL=1